MPNTSLPDGYRYKHAKDFLGPRILLQKKRKLLPGWMTIQHSWIDIHGSVPETKAFLKTKEWGWLRDRSGEVEYQ